MKLTINNIRFVKELTVDGMPYCWYVAMKSHCVCDSREYKHVDEKGWTVFEEYPAELLPKTVQKFIQKSIREEFMPEHETKYGAIAHYIYR